MDMILPNGQVCTCGVGNFHPVAHADFCPASKPDTLIDEFFPPLEVEQANAKEDTALANEIGHRANAAVEEMNQCGPEPEDITPINFDPDAQRKRSLTKFDITMPLSSDTGLTFTDTNLTLPALDDDSKKAEKDRARIVNFGAHASQLKGQDTHVVSGVGAVDAESIQVVAKVNKKKLFEVGYDVEEEGREFAKRTGLVAESSFAVDGEEVTVLDVPEKPLAEEGVITNHGMSKSGPLTEMVRKWLKK